MIAASLTLSQIEAPPIAEAFSWLAERTSLRELVNLCQAVPSYPPAEILQQEIARLAKTDGVSGYTEVLGIAELRKVHASSLSTDYRADIPPSGVAIASGCNQAFAAAILALCEKGTNVVLPTPWYFNHHMWLGMLGVESRPIDAINEAGEHPAVADAAARIDKNTRAIVLCSPNNPTGQVYPPHIITAFFELAKTHNIALILDETYRDFRPDTAPPHTLFLDPSWPGTLIQLYSFSKIYAMAGYRLGSIVCGTQLIPHIEKVLDCMAICPPHITQRAVLFGLQHLQAWKQGKRALMAERLAALRESFGQNFHSYQLVSSGAYFAYIRHPFHGTSSRDVARRLAVKHDVLCLPGSMFGPGQDAYLRLAFANVGVEKIPLIAERLAESQAVWTGNI